MTHDSIPIAPVNPEGLDKIAEELLKGSFPPEGTSTMKDLLEHYSNINNNEI